METQKTRLRFSFWLDIARDDEYTVAEQIQILKRKRNFTKTIRDGVRLICDLRLGKLDVLFDLFPWVKAEFIAGVAQKSDTDPSNNERLQRELEQIKELLLRNSTPPMVAASTGKPLVAAAARTLNAPKFDLPTFDDDDDGDTLVIAKDSSSNSAQNFLDSILGFQQ